MTTLKLVNDDLAFENNNLVMVNGADEVAQNLRNELRFFAGEWFLDTDLGVPFFEDVFKKNPDPAIIDAIFKNKILNTAGVIELLEYNLELNGRKLELSFKARAVDGIINFNEVL